MNTIPSHRHVQPDHSPAIDTARNQIPDNQRYRTVTTRSKGRISDSNLLKQSSQETTPYSRKAVQDTCIPETSLEPAHARMTASNAVPGPSHPTPTATCTHHQTGSSDPSEKSHRSTDAVSAARPTVASTTVISPGDHLYSHVVSAKRSLQTPREEPSHHMRASFPDHHPHSL